MRDKIYCVWKTGEFCLTKDSDEFTELLNTKEPYKIITPGTQYNVLLDWMGVVKTENFLRDTSCG